MTNSDNNVYKGIIKGKNIYFCLCNSKSIAEQAQLNFELSPLATIALGQVLTMAALMGASLKDKQTLSIIINGSGPLGTIVAKADNNGNVKGLVANPFINVDTNFQKVSDIIGLPGTLKVSKDLGLKNSFHSELELQTAEIGEDFSYYFLKSEQIPTVVSLGVLLSEDAKVKNAAGLLIQLLPDHSEEDLIYLETLSSTLPKMSKLIENNFEVDQFLKIIFEEYEILASSNIQYNCDCSSEKFYSHLSLLPKGDIEEMINDNNGCHIKCNFCAKEYNFNNEDLKQIIKGK